MLDRSDQPCERFSDLAEGYAKHRPDYPTAALEHIEAHTGRGGPGRLLVDVGCGTGISARLFAARGWPVVGIEPNDPMREQAERVGGSIRYQKGTAEATGLPDGCATVVLAAQAFHWFRADESLTEFQRLLKPDGWAALVWNVNDESDPFTGDYRATLRHFSADPVLHTPHYASGAALVTSSLFALQNLNFFAHGQDLDVDGLIGRATSVSYAPREPAAAAAYESALRDLFARHQHGGQVRLVYRTAVYLGRRSA
jgi:SAM-dependent methyltransferase